MPKPPIDDKEYASIGMGFGAGPVDPADEIDEVFIETGMLPFEPEVPSRAIDELLGLAILRLRLYRGL